MFIIIKFEVQNNALMARPRNNRVVYEPPQFAAFKPVGVPGRDLGESDMTIDEFEALRLADYMGLSHEEAALEMEISRSTFTRLVEEARKKVAGFLVNGNLLTIEGGQIHFRNNVIRCLDCGHMFKIRIGSEFNRCPDCHSERLQSLAGGFGHGRCCANNFSHG